jgi:hypothetical protein
MGNVADIRLSVYTCAGSVYMSFAVKILVFWDVTIGQQFRIFEGT